MAIAASSQSVRPVAAAARAKRVEHQAVPLGQHLVVEAGPDATLTRLEEAPPRLLDLGRPLEITAHRTVEDVRTLEVARLRDAVPLDRPGREVGAEHVFDLLDSPYVEAALLALGVGVLGRREAALGLAQIAQHIGDRLVEHLPPARLTDLLPRVQVGAGEERLVVEHLLEVGDHPERVDRVAREPPAEVVVHAARRHRVERGGHDSASPVTPVVRVGAQAELERHRLRELRCLPEPSPFGVELRPDLLQRVVEHVGARQGLALGRRHGRHAVEGLRDLPRLLEQLGAPLTPCVGDRREQVEELVLRVVGAAEERLTV